MEHQPVQWKQDHFSELELQNRKFRRLAIIAALLFLAVAALLIVQVVQGMK